MIPILLKNLSREEVSAHVSQVLGDRHDCGASYVVFLEPVQRDAYDFVARCSADDCEGSPRDREVRFSMTGLELAEAQVCSLEQAEDLFVKKFREARAATQQSLTAEVPA